MRTRTMLLALGCLLVACSGSSDETIPSATEVASSSAAPATTSTSTSSSTTSTSAPYPTTTVHVVPADCDPTLVLAEVDASLQTARLVPGGAWSLDDAVATPFDEATQDAEEFRYRMGLDCRLRATQTTAAGDERLLLASWTGERAAYVVQATDAPATPFRADQRVQLLVEVVWGEWIENQFVWAGTMASGASIVVGTVDAPFAVAAKAWPAAVPRFEDLPVTIAAEQYAIDALWHAGARNVSVGEPAAEGSQLGAVQFVTPLGLHLIATVASTGWFDPASPLVEGEMTVVDVDGVAVHVTTGSPDSYAVASVGWACGDFVWFIDSLYGTVDELTDWARTLITTSACPG